AMQNRGSVTVAMADVDHFKNINDTYGHAVGDVVLSELAQRMLRSVRPYDAVGRYGGEEFLIVFEGCGSAEAVRLAERLRKCVSEEQIQSGEASLSVTISLGVAVSAPEGEPDHEPIIRRADAALYLAKKNGRNRAEYAPISSTNDSSHESRQSAQEDLPAHPTSK
ncbi:MAG TPA: GGDEF domain-containing protein, partial [Acidobacteriota bacterium]|nr:GGDEF domain-containing protein [Acidobacteriota bacterium]